MSSAVPLIYSRMSKVMGAVGAIEKDRKNEQQRYQYRGIDDAFNALNKPLTEAGVFFVPEVIESSESTFESKSGTRQVRVKLKVKYTFYAEDGSSIVSVVEGENIDSSDKATNKALQAACKYMLFQVFCIPVEEADDADKTSPKLPAEKKPDPGERFKEKPAPAPAAAPKASGPKPKCYLCGTELRQSKGGKGYYCPNFQNTENGEHARVPVAKLDEYMVEQALQEMEEAPN